MDSPGKSGAKFYQSYDKLFIIKSLTSEEVERMHSFLKHYHPVSIVGGKFTHLLDKFIVNVTIVLLFIMQYIVERHGKTLLPQYLGMYRLTVDGVEYYLVAMRNVFSSHLATHR